VLASAGRCCIVTFALDLFRPSSPDLADSTPSLSVCMLSGRTLIQPNSQATLALATECPGSFAIAQPDLRFASLRAGSCPTAKPKAPLMDARPT
jgi:hypothetical protein